MAYRGDDLDLRTPQGWSSSGRDAGEQPNWWTRATIYKGGRGDPIWVDDSVMACCNHAYDLALAHRAPEVRLEHLINALTLNEHAAQVLDARGLSVASLRRESGAAIANDIAASSALHGTPRRSEAVEEALRLAADHAYPRRTPVTVDDLLHVLFDMKRDLPGLHLLQKHATSWNGRNGADLRLEPLPHLSRPGQSISPRYASTGAHDYFSQAAREPEPVTRAMPTATREPPVRREPSRSLRESASVDMLQDNRLDSLERAVRDIGVDLADERKTLRTLVTDLQRSTAAQADDAGRFRGGLSERLNQLEDNLHRSRSESAALPSTVLDRMAALERSIERNIDARLAEVGRASQPAASVLDRISSIERNMEGRLIELGRITAAVLERLQAVESAPNRPVEATLSPLVSQRLDAITAFAGKIEALERTFQLMLDRMTGVERKLATAGEGTKFLDLSGVEARLLSIESGVKDAAQQGIESSPLTELLSGIEARIAGLERSLDNRTAETGRTVSFIGERLRAFEEAIGSQRTLMVDRLGQIERSLTAYAEGTVANGGSHERELGEVHEALLKLNANQQTLAGTLDQWRLDNTGDLSVINNRLKVMEEGELKRGPNIDILAQQLAALHAGMAKREVRKSRFRHWLFGTDEWYSASYDTRRWRARQIDPAPQRPADVLPTAVATRPTPPAPPPTALRR